MKTIKKISEDLMNYLIKKSLCFVIRYNELTKRKELVVFTSELKMNLFVKLQDKMNVICYAVAQPSNIEYLYNV